MKANGNDQRVGNYYIGLDVGTDSVGWAVTDEQYNVLRFKGNSMWGARLFDEASDASVRRATRTNRRRIQRRNQRLLILESLFVNEIIKLDPNFFVRMRESNLWQDDRSDSSYHYVLFNDKNYTDKDYLKQYPTVYHLRSDLIHDKNPHDIRLVYLAIHHILKSRGHFLYESSESSEDGKTLDQAIEDLKLYLSGYDTEFNPENLEKFKLTLSNGETISNKKRELLDSYGPIPSFDNEIVEKSCLVELLSGASLKLEKLFQDDALKNADVTSISLKDDLESKYDLLSETLNDDRLELILMAKEVFDIARIHQFLGNSQFLSDAKVDQYNKNHSDLGILKAYIRKNNPDECKIIFNDIEGQKNYAAYSRYKTDNKCTQEEFCNFLKGKVDGMKESDNSEERRIYEEIVNKTFLPRLKGSDNGIIPNQLHLKELKAILKNASEYLPFLNEKDEEGLTVSEKIVSTFTFRIPYFVGPLNQKSGNFWAVRGNDHVYPWNMERVVDLEKSAQEFMNQLIGRCTYTKEPVLPLNSLLYSEYMVLNELNPIKVNGHPLDTETKNKIYDALFVNSKKKVTKKTIKNYLIAQGLITQEDEISGIDDVFKSNLKSFHDFKTILEKTNDEDQVERIIKSLVVFSSDKKMMKRWLDKSTHGLSENDKKYILRLNYKDWGRLSKAFLTEIYHVDECGEATNIIESLRKTNCNLMQLLSSDFQYSDNCKKYLIDHGYETNSIRQYLDDLYIAPAVKRSIRQTLKIMDEVVDIRKGAPKKIFIEMARDNAKDVKKQRTQSRKTKLLELYKSCKEQSRDLIEKLEQETDQSLRRDKLYLYYTQFGKCMYSGDPIDLEMMLKDDDTYDIDHIYPRSKIKDNSLTNRVLVKSSLNRDKTNKYPISSDIQKKMGNFWSLLKDKKLISEEKYNRLVRSYGLTDEELSSFVARQIVETRQSTKALAEVLNELYPNSEIVYSKAGNVSDFRQEFNLVKMREVNDLHHAKDAYLNIVVGNVYHTKFTEKFFLNIANENYSLNRVFDFDVPGAWSSDGSSINLVRKYMAKNNPIVTFMPVINKGMIADLTIKEKGKGQLPVKKGKPIEKYGGYNNVYGAYFAYIEHKKGKKVLRTIVPVFIHDESKYVQEKEHYFEAYGYVDPKIIIEKIPYNSLLVLDNKRLILTGRSNKQLIYKHSKQLAIDDDHVRYLKNVKKYVDRCTAAKKELNVTPHDLISNNENIGMYEWFIR